MRFKGEATDVQDNVGDLDGEGEDTVEKRDEPAHFWVESDGRTDQKDETRDTDCSYHEH